MALASWMNHEEARDKKLKRVLVKEEEEPLYIRAKKISSMAIISNHNIISIDAKPEPRYLDTQDQAISHFEDTLRLLGRANKLVREDGIPYHTVSISLSREIEKCIG